VFVCSRRSLRVVALHCVRRQSSLSHPASARPHHGGVRPLTLILLHHHFKQGHLRLIVITHMALARSGSAAWQQIKRAALSDPTCIIATIICFGMHGTSSGSFVECGRRARRLPAAHPPAASACGVEVMNWFWASVSTAPARTCRFVRKLWPAWCPTAGRLMREWDGAYGGRSGVVSGIDAGHPIVVSGNNGNRVREPPFCRGGFMPTSCRRTDAS